VETLEWPFKHNFLSKFGVIPFTMLNSAADMP